MKYVHILMAVASEIWAMRPDKMAAIIEFLSTQAADVKFTAEEIEARIAPQTARAVARKDGAVAIIPIRGVIANRMARLDNVSGGGGASTEQIAQQIRAAVNDEGVKAIVLDVDSPGGAVSGTDELAGLIMSLRGSKPIVAQVNATAASAAYWSIAGVDEIVVTPSGEVGSIGVYTVHDNIKAALEKAGVEKTIIGAGPYKTENNPYGPLGEEALASIQEKVDAYYSMFIDRVASGRGVATSAVRSGFGQGRMVMAKHAIEMGMADRIGTMEETLQRFGVGGSQPEPRRRAFATEREKRALLL